jgi:hypothetical protein
VDAEGDRAEALSGTDLSGVTLVPQRFVIDSARVDDYVRSVGDERFPAFAAAVRSREGIRVAPLTIFDRYMSTYLVGNDALAGKIPPFGVHAKQVSRFCGELLVGHRYDLVGSVRGIQRRRNMEYLSVTCDCVDVLEPGKALIAAVYTRAQGFQHQQYGRSEGRARPSLASWLTEMGADATASFPAKGSVVEGSSRRVTQDRLDLFLGPGPNFHTDPVLARRLGFEGTIAAGVMATELECELYRELFDLGLFRGAELEVSYVAPIPEGVELQPVCVVERSDGDALSLRSAVCTGSGTLVTISRIQVMVG